MQVSLIVNRGKSAGKEIVIPTPVFLIGRGEDCHLRPKSDAISRRHCELSIEKNAVWVKDLGSRNGTLVNGEKIADRVELQSGDVVRIGKLEFQLKVVKPLKLTPNAPSDVADWLEGEEDTEAKQIAAPETRQFKLDETSHGELQRAAERVERAASDDDAGSQTMDGSQTIDGSEESSDDTTGFFLGRGKKKEKKAKPGKLPQRSGPTSESSTSAAAETLKNFFNNRS